MATNWPLPGRWPAGRPESTAEWQQRVLGHIFNYIEGFARAHHVNPLVFALIYIASTPLFLLVSGWLIHHIRKRRRLEELAFAWALLYAAPYIYVLIVGENLAAWIYLLIAALIVGGLALAARGLWRRLNRESE